MRAQHGVGHGVEVTAKFRSAPCLPLNTGKPSTHGPAPRRTPLAAGIRPHIVLATEDVHSRKQLLSRQFNVRHLSADSRRHRHVARNKNEADRSRATKTGQRRASDRPSLKASSCFTCFSALAEFERSLIRERTRAGLAAARRVGLTRRALPIRSRSENGVRACSGVEVTMRLMLRVQLLPTALPEGAG